MNEYPWVHFTDEPGIVQSEVHSSRPRGIAYEGGKRPGLIQPEVQPTVPKPSTQPPMWAQDPTRSRRPRRNRGQPNRQGIA